MAYIKYKVSSIGEFDKIITSLNSARQSIIDNYSKKFQDLQAQSNKIFVQINNGIDTLVFSETEIAQAASSKLVASGAYESIGSLFQKMSNEITDSQSFLDKEIDENLQTLINLRDGYIPDGDYSIEGKNSLEALYNAGYRAKLLKQNLYNKLGNIGESISEVAGAALTAAVLEELIASLGSIENVTVQKQNLGDTQISGYKSQTDNRFIVNFTVSKTGAQGTFVLNLSDKAGSKLFRSNNAKIKTTGNSYWKRSSVGILSNEDPSIEPFDYYNAISYHRLSSNVLERAWGPYQALMSYYGYKLLIKMFLESKEHEDQINFTIFGGHIIPEQKVFDKLMGLQLQGISAEVPYWQLIQKRDNRLVATVSSKDEAEAKISKMPVSIRASVAF